MENPYNPSNSFRLESPYMMFKIRKSTPELTQIISVLKITCYITSISSIFTSFKTNCIPDSSGFT